MEIAILTLRVLFKTYVLATLLLLCFQAEAKKYNIVFDLDETLIFSIKDAANAVGPTVTWTSREGGTNRVFTYRVADGAPALLQMLSLNPNVDISFFSAGMEERNRAVLSKIILPDGTTAESHAKYILSAEDLELDLETVQLQKGLSKHFPAIEDVIIVDDNKDFIKVTEAASHLDVRLIAGENGQYGDLQRTTGILHAAISSAEKSQGSLTDSLSKAIHSATPANHFEQRGKKLLDAMKTCTGRTIWSLIH